MEDPLKVQTRDVIGQYKLPVDVRFCVRCTVSNQRPRITFDAHGVCSACNYAQYKRKHVYWNEREQQLLADWEKRKHEFLSTPAPPFPAEKQHTRIREFVDEIVAGKANPPHL